MYHTHRSYWKCLLVLGKWVEDDYHSLFAITAQCLIYKIKVPVHRAVLRSTTHQIKHLLQYVAWHNIVYSVRFQSRTKNIIEHMQTSQHSAWHAVKPSFPFQKCLNDSPFPTEQNTEASKIYLVLNCLSRLISYSFHPRVNRPPSCNSLRSLWKSVTSHSSGDSSRK